MCKHIFQACLGAIVLTATTVTHALSVSSPTIHPMPLQPVEQQGTGVIGFTLTEDNGKDIAFDQDNALPVMVEVALNKLRLDETMPILGDVAEYFSVNFNEDSQTIVLSQHAQIPAHIELVVNLPVRVTGNARIESTYDVGFEASVLSPYEQFETSAKQYTFTSAYGVSVVRLVEPSIAPMPLAPVEEGGKGHAEFELTVHGDEIDVVEKFGMPNIQVSILHSGWIALENADVGSVSGSVLEYFDVTYYDNTLYLNQKAVIPAMAKLDIKWPITVLKNSSKSESLNMFNANVSAIDIGTVALGHASAQTYTRVSSLDESVEIANEHALWRTDLEAEQVLAYTLANPFAAR